MNVTPKKDNNEGKLPIFSEKHAIETSQIRISAENLVKFASPNISKYLSSKFLRAFPKTNLLHVFSTCHVFHKYTDIY